MVNVIADTLAALTDYIRLHRADERIPAATVKKEFDTAVSKLRSPFVLANSGDFDRVKSEISSESGDEYIKKLTEYAIYCAKETCDTSKNPPYEYIFTDGERLLEISRCVMSRLMTLCFAYRVTGERIFAERALLEMKKVCAFPDWHHQHFLDAAEMAFAVSLSCDWLFDFLSEEQKSFFANEVYNKAVRYALAKNPLKVWFTWSKTNWNTVCFSAIGIACLVFYKYYNKEAVQFITKAVNNMPIAFEMFSPDGVYVEGSGYFKYGMSYYTYFISTLRNCFGHDFSLSSYEGCKKIGYFPLYIESPCGVFNTGDNKNEKLFSSSLFRFSKEYNEPLLTAYQKRYDLEKSRPREAALGALWYDKELGGTLSYNLPKAVLMKSDKGESLAVFRSEYLSDRASFFAIKGGYNYTNHGDLDIGSFVIEAKGIRWALESGPGNYNAKGYFNGLPYGGRYKNFRKRAEGHNTLVINPQKTFEDQYPFARCDITDFCRNESGGEGVLDMTEAYRHSGAKRVVRRFKVSEDCSTVTVTDEILCRKKSQIYWLMQTAADIKLSEDGKSCILTQDGEKISVNLNCENALFSVSGLEPIKDFSRYNGNEKNRDNGAKHRLCVAVKDIKKTRIEVVFSLG